MGSFVQSVLPHHCSTQTSDSTEAPSQYRQVFSPVELQKMADGQCRRSLHCNQAASGLLMARSFLLREVASTMRSSLCWFSPSCPKLGSSVSSKLKLAFSLEMKFPNHQDFISAHEMQGMETLVKSLRFQGEAEMYLQSRLIPHSTMRLQMAICFPTVSCHSWQTLLPVLHVGLQVSLLTQHYSVSCPSD